MKIEINLSKLSLDTLKLSLDPSNSINDLKNIIIVINIKLPIL